MITNTAPWDRQPRPLPRIPQTINICINCTGTCVDLPGFGVACLLCRGKCYATVTIDRAVETRAKITALFGGMIAYPVDLLAARRAAFIAEIEARNEEQS